MINEDYYYNMFKDNPLFKPLYEIREKFDGKIIVERKKRISRKLRTKTGRYELRIKVWQEGGKELYFRDNDPHKSHQEKDLLLLEVEDKDLWFDYEGWETWQITLKDYPKRRSHKRAIVYLKIRTPQEEYVYEVWDLSGYCKVNNKLYYNPYICYLISFCVVALKKKPPIDFEQIRIERGLQKPKVNKDYLKRLQKVLGNWGG